MNRRNKAVLGLLALLPALGVAGTWLAAAASTRPVPLGAPGGRLAPCPDTPNCVSTQADPADRLHGIEPIAYDGSLADARSRMLAALEAAPRITIIRSEPDYIAAEARTAFFRFVDDIDIAFDDSAKLIHFRSASRLGQGDLGVNRNRMEDIRERFLAARP